MNQPNHPDDPDQRDSNHVDSNQIDTDRADSNHDLELDLRRSLLPWDPAAQCNAAELEAATVRLMARWESESAFNDLSPVANNDSSGRGTRTLWWIALAATVVGLLITGGWIYRGRNIPDGSIAEREVPPSKESAAEPDRLANDHRQPEPSVESVVDIKPNDAEVTSVIQLLNLPPRLVQARLRKADQTALQTELTDWLKKWRLGNPMERREMESQWSNNRQFWLVWSMQSIEQFEDPDVQAAAIELISLDLGHTAKPFLERCLANTKLSGAALPHWIPLADDHQLVVWLRSAKDCGEVRRVLQQLAGRDSVAATDALAGVASQSACSQLLHDISGWNPAHLERAMATVGRGHSQTQFQSAMLLAAIPDSSVDQQLLGTIQRGVQILPATAVLLLRDAGHSKNTVAKVEQAPTVASAMMSARLQVQRWQEQAKRMQISISQEVCKQCEQKS